MINHYVIVLNPTAGKGYAEKKIPLIKEFFTSHDQSYSLEISQSREHAIALSRTAASQAGTAVIAAGGDGTVNEVVNGLMQASVLDGAAKPIMGVIPIGRGNDFSCGAHLPMDFQESLDVLMKKDPFPLDTGFVKGGDYPEGIYFGNGIGAGLDAIIGFEANKMKSRHDESAYILAVLKIMALYPKLPRVTIDIDGKITETNPIILSVNNGTRMGGSFYMTPDAVMDDGLFDICIIPRLPRFRLPGIMSRFLKGTQGVLKETTFKRGRNISITAPSGGMPGHADGEKLCEDGLELEITCLPSALRLLK